jgi:hypothetical protein
MPFEPYDPQPMYCLEKSDCLVFTEHTYAMALSQNWPSFMKMLQRIRYNDGRIGVVTRNHYTELDWNESNRWLVEDITAKLAGDAAVNFEELIDRAKFLKSRYGLEVNVNVVKHQDVYLPFEEINRAKGQLRDGDFVNVVRGTVKQGAAPNEIFGGSAYVGHTGLIALSEDGDVHLIHSSEPKSVKRTSTPTLPAQQKTWPKRMRPARRGFSASSSCDCVTIRSKNFARSMAPMRRG